MQKQNVVITGGTDGIGKAAAIQLAKSGVRWCAGLPPTSPVSTLSCDPSGPTQSAKPVSKPLLTGC